MRNRNLIPILYAVSILSVGPVLIAKSMHIGDPFTGLTICLAAQLLFAFAAIAELRNAQQITEKEKSRWRVLLLCSPLIFGFFYLRNMRAKSFQQG